MHSDEDEVEYGTWEFTAEDALAEERRLRPLQIAEDIWPRWSDGVPTKLRRISYSPPFTKGSVRHRGVSTPETVELEWSSPHLLSKLRKRYGLLPANTKREWSGVYRIFAPDTTMSRLCGNDPTGTLYLGLAGTGKLSWSILRGRLMAAAKGEHQATNRWFDDSLLAKKYPWESIAVEWAYTGERLDYRGEPVPAAKIAEAWLLLCYRDSFGEFPPLNEKG